MKILEGLSAFSGIAMGPVHFKKKLQFSYLKKSGEGIEEEIRRGKEAFLKSIAKEEEFYQKALLEMQNEDAKIFSVHALMLSDEILQNSVFSLVQKGHTMEYAVKKAFTKQEKLFRRMEDPYFRERAEDMQDILNLMLSILSGKEVATKEKPCILLAEDLGPSDTIRFPKDNLLGFITEKGSLQSHTAILAASLGIPALVQCKGLRGIEDGEYCIIDGEKSVAYFSPTEEVLAHYREIMEKKKEERQELEKLRDEDCVSLDGKRMNLYGNMSSPVDVKKLLKSGAEGIGLYRTEFLFLEEGKLPSEEKQFQSYRAILEEMKGREVIIRTCDLGADKVLPYHAGVKEENPALGLRGIRFCLMEKEMFCTQIRALLRASAYGKLSVMLPMISSLEEVRESKALFRKCRTELEKQGVPMAERIPVGVMIETPAAVFIAGDLAKEVDFFSIGTNDLSQYLLAIDRQNAMVHSFYHKKHPAILRAIKEVVEKGKQAGISVGVCGEFAADPDFTAFFLHLGVDKLSMNGPAILPIKKKILGCDSSKELNRIP
ncbi:phosphoenolpyruvate--protein phosphotransferase [Oribacterium sinus]